MSLSAKDPAEIITVTFDFAALATSVATPVITCQAIEGRDDATASAMLSGAAVISGLTVMQRVIGGQSGTTYKLRCQVDDADGERWVTADTLKVVDA